MRLFLQKQDKNIEKNKAAGNEKLPYFRLVKPPEEGETEWKEVAAFWKKEKGYSGKLADNVEITFKKSELSEEDKQAIIALKAASKKDEWPTMD